jgi:hypothetical protein
MDQQQVQTNNNIIPNKTLVTTSPNENNIYTVATRRAPASTAGAKGPNTIRKSQPKQNLATYFAQPLESKECSHITPLSSSQVFLFYTREEGEITWYMEL